MDKSEILRVYVDLEQTARNAGLEIASQDIEVHLVNRSHLVALLARSGASVRYPHWSFGLKGEKHLQRIRDGRGMGDASLFFPSRPPRLFLHEDMPLHRICATFARSLAYQDFCARNEYIIRTDYTKVWRELREHQLFVDELESSSAIESDLLEETKQLGHAVVAQTGHAVWGRGHSDIIGHILEFPQLATWQKDLLGIIRQEWLALLPLYETWGMRMGYGLFWEQKLLRDTVLPEGVAMKCLRELAVRIKVPREVGPVNSERVFFKIFKHLEEGRSKTIQDHAISTCNDPMFVTNHLTQGVAADSGLLAWGKRDEDKSKVVVTELSVDQGWQQIRDIFARESGSNRFPVFHILNFLSYKVGEQTKDLEGFILQHDFDGRFLQTTQLDLTGKLLASILGQEVIMATVRANADDLFPDVRTFATPNEG